MSSRKIPTFAITASAALLLVGVLLNCVVPERAFAYVTGIATVGALWTWAIILVSHLGYRKAVCEGRARQSSYRMPGAPWTN